jgi:ABC-type lipoprotein export system ATPase subunit
MSAGTTIEPGVERRRRSTALRAQPPEAETAPVLEVRDAHLAYRRGATHIPVLQGATASVGRGEIVAVVGRSGSGKSTLLHVAGLLAAPDRGTVRVEGSEVSAAAPRHRARVRRQRIGFVFQAYHLLAGLTAAENVALPLTLDGRPRLDALTAARRSLALVDLADRADHRPGELSGGEAQRVAIARALVGDPAVVLADEPTGSLDTASAAAVLDVLTERCRRAGVACAMVTHDPAIAERADRVLHMSDGRLQ